MIGETKILLPTLNQPPQVVYIIDHGKRVGYWLVWVINGKEIPKEVPRACLSDFDLNEYMQIDLKYQINACDITKNRLQKVLNNLTHENS